MCGIIAVLRRRSRRAPPAPEVLLRCLHVARTALERGAEVDALRQAGAALAELDRHLRGVPGLLCLLALDQSALAAMQQELDDLQAAVQRLEAELDLDSAAATDEVERRNAAMIALKDALWAVRNDRLPHAAGVRELARGTVPHAAAAAACSALQTALSALDRLEVRGRDSAGLSVLISGLDPTRAPLPALLAARGDDPLFLDGAARLRDGTLNLVYKRAAEIGELGDNVRALRQAMIADDLLQAALQDPDAEVLVLGHTRWASIGIISEANAHPLNQEETGRTDGPYVIGALNGDVDNHEELKTRHGLQLASEITTDAKVIPALVSRQMAGGLDLGEAFRRTVTGFEGSVAVAAAATAAPHRLALALRGSGQALYVGLGEDACVVASEPYGVIEECERYLRLDGETPGNPQNAAASRGQVVLLDRAGAGELAGIRRLAYDGTELPPRDDQLTRAAITTRDIDRAGFRHFLHKEISEAPRSMQKTLRGRITRHGNRLRAGLPERSLPTAVRDGLGQGRFRRILVIGQGTAAVAGQAVAAALAETLARAPIEVRALPATELSGFGLLDAMADTLVVAISQSGTTTDTNRTVDLVRGRGAPVLAIVNRRGSDLCDKADGVIFTSDGRDVEMSVASTKAFYAQCAAGWILALCVARAAGVADDAREHDLLQALLDLPTAMGRVLAADPVITAAAARFAPPRRHWALVGNGPNRVAAEEVRIKLSELCYQSIACDATEDKKHIDLSSEPLVLVCAAGLSGSTADDVAKEVAIFRAHKACPIVVATAGESRFGAAAAVIEVPPMHPSLAFLLSTMAGHLFGYRAALAIDALALPLRAARGAIETVTSDPALRHAPLDNLRLRLLPHAGQFRADLLQGRYDGALEARTAARLTSLLHYAAGVLPLESYAIEFGAPGTPGAVVDALATELTTAIDQLTRPVDAIKHQAKTVTVGISRADEALLTVPLVRAVLEAGAGRDRLGYRDLRALAGLDAAVTEVLGSTRYAITGDVEAGTATIAVVDQRGIAARLRSRTARNPTLKGTKHLVALERQCLVAKGRSDDRTVILVPEVEQGRAAGLTLLHVQFAGNLPAATLRGVLGGYRNRYAALQDSVMETEPEFDEALLETMPVVELLTEPVAALADRWRQGQLQE